jgi:hypothetical protein
MGTPDDNEMCATRRISDNGQRRQCVSGLEKHMIDGNDDLLGLKIELDRNFLERIDGGSIHIGMTRFTKTSIADGYTESFQQRLENGRSTIHSGGLNDLWGEQPPTGARSRCSVTVVHGCVSMAPV